MAPIKHTLRKVHVRLDDDVVKIPSASSDERVVAVYQPGLDEDTHTVVLASISPKERRASPPKRPSPPPKATERNSPYAEGRSFGYET